jgi:nucleotide-binding universal stress UspA family protein
MPPFRTILVAADFSESSRDAFGVACSLAREDKARIVVLHVMEPHFVPESPVYFGQQTVHFTAIPRDPAEHEALQSRLREVYNAARAADVDYRTKEGSEIAEEILRTAAALGCELIAMGTHGQRRTGPEQPALGSVAEAVLSRACRRVLAVKAIEPAAGADDEAKPEKADTESRAQT